jgi:PAS domain S-box-containing protein
MQATNNKPRILIVDDDHGMQRTLELILRGKDYAVETASSGQEGIEKARGRAFNVALLDIKLPDMRGVDLLTPLQNLHPDMAMIVITGYASVQTAIQALNDGAAAYVTKPLDVDEVLAAIESALEKQRLIQDKRRAERALRKSREKYRLLAEHAADVIYKLDLETERYTYMSPSVERVLGYPPEEASSLRPRQVLTSASYVKQRERMEEALLSGKMLSEPLEFEALHKEGHIVPVEVHAKFILDQRGVPVEILGVARDITERKRMEEQLLQQERLAALGQMASGIAHDFRNRLNPITLYAEMALNDRDLPPRLIANVETILEESRGMAELVQQILDFTSRAMIDRQPLDVAVLADEVAQALRRRLPDDVQIRVRQGPGEYVVLADDGRIRQALTNLALNARDAMPHGGDLRFDVSRVAIQGGSPPLPSDGQSRSGPTEWVCLAVSDTGTGMTEEVRARVFEPFFTTKDVGQGTGLGLSQVHGIVRQHDGRIDVETSPGEGTTVRIYLLAYHKEKEREAEEADGREPSDASPAEGASILLVEGDPGRRKAVRTTLESLGYRVLTTANGRGALALSQSPRWDPGEPPADLVIINDDAIEMDAAALARELRRSFPRIRLLLAGSGPGLDHSAEAGEEAGFWDAMQSPFETQELECAVRQAIERDEQDERDQRDDPSTER